MTNYHLHNLIVCPLPGTLQLAFRQSASGLFSGVGDQAGHHPVISLPAKDLTDSITTLLECSPTSDYLSFSNGKLPYRCWLSCSCCVSFQQATLSSSLDP